MDSAIKQFFQDRKDAWLKKNTKASMSDVEIQQLQPECDEVFSLEQWLPSAAKRAGQISISTHPCTFSHPSARKNKNGYVSSIIANTEQAADGYLRSGNVEVEMDALGNAAALDVHKFLTLELADGQTLLSHLQGDSKLAKKALSIKSQSYDELKSGFLAMVGESSDLVTSSKIKQVYFPIADEQYHQLSLLTASGLVFALRKRVDELRFSDEVKEIRACKNSGKPHPKGEYKQLNNITTIAYGGTKPQNISVLNNKNAGKAHLLLSLPPVLGRRNIQFPNQDFFTQSVNLFQSNIKTLFYSLHSLFQNHKNDWGIRNERSAYYTALIERISEVMWQVRSVSEQQYRPETSQLPNAQKLWLCHDYSDTREIDEQWLPEISDRVASFIFHGYKTILKKNAFDFGDKEFEHIHAIVLKHQEALR